MGSSANFRFEFPDFYKAGGVNDGMGLIGSDTSLANPLRLFAGVDMYRTQIDGQNSDVAIPFDYSQVVEGFEVKRVIGSPASQRITYAGTTYTGSVNTYICRFNLIGAFTDTSFKFNGEWTGVLNIYDGTDTLIHSYNFEDGSIPNQLTDTVGGNHGILSGFSEGAGFQTSGGGSSSTIAINQPAELETRYMDAGQYSRFPVSGSYTGDITTIYTKINGGVGQPLESLVIDEVNETFEGTILVPNGTNDIEFYMTNDTSATQTVNNVRSVYSILIWGQSNGNGAGPNNQTLVLDSGAPYPLMCGAQSYSQIETLKDPTAGQNDTPGSMWPKFASYLANEGVLICLTNTCINGSALSSWVEGGENHDRPERLFELVGGYNIAISVIGESDSNNSETIVYDRMSAVINSYKLKYGCDTYIAYVPNSDRDSYDTEVNTFGRIIDENRFAKFGGYLGVIDVDVNDDPNIPADGVHLLTEAQLTQGAQIVYAAYKEDRGRGYYQSDAVMTLTGASGTKPTRIINLDTGHTAFMGDVEWVNGTATVKVDAKVAANIEYNIMDTAGGMQRGVTV